MLSFGSKFRFCNLKLRILLVFLSTDVKENECLLFWKPCFSFRSAKSILRVAIQAWSRFQSCALCLLRKKVRSHLLMLVFDSWQGQRASHPSLTSVTLRVSVAKQKFKWSQKRPILLTGLAGRRVIGHLRQLKMSSIDAQQALPWHLLRGNDKTWLIHLCKTLCSEVRNQNLVGLV